MTRVIDAASTRGPSLGAMSRLRFCHSNRSPLKTTELSLALSWPPSWPTSPIAHELDNMAHCAFVAAFHGGEDCLLCMYSRQTRRWRRWCPCRRLDVRNREAARKLSRVCANAKAWGRRKACQLPLLYGDLLGPLAATETQASPLFNTNYPRIFCRASRRTQRLLVATHAISSLSIFSTTRIWFCSHAASLCAQRRPGRRWAWSPRASCPATSPDTSPRTERRSEGSGSKR